MVHLKCFPRKKASLLRSPASQRGFQWGTLALLVILFVVLLSGCARSRYRKSADREAYGLIRERASQGPWALEAGFSIQPDPISRLHDTGDPDDPKLPDPGPHLYAYKLPLLQEVEGESVREVDDPMAQSADVVSGSQARVAVGSESRIGSMAIQPIPTGYWDDLPPGCLARMIEFASVREEYQKRYQAPPSAEMGDQAERLSLHRIIQLARMESREYQTQKERLYRAALALTQERFEYKPRFSSDGAGSSSTLSQTRSGGQSEAALSTQSNLQGRQVIPTGGSLLVGWANDVVVRFDGPEGLTTDIGSRFLFNLNQSLFQRDVRLNPLIQAERDVIYGAREYARFRKTFFEGLAAAYYSLLQTFRSIEIESQNYFSLIRTFEQAREEVRSGVKNAPNQVAVDQFEQSMLSGRSRLISTWNNLEERLDDLKIRIGIPTETPLNIELGELEQLTLLDEIEVAGGRVRRWQSRVGDRLTHPNPNRNELLNANIFLIQRLLEWFELRRKAEGRRADTHTLELQLLRFQVDTAELGVRQAQADLAAGEVTATRNPLIMRFQGNTALIEARLRQGSSLLELARRQDPNDEALETSEGHLSVLGEDLKALYESLETVLDDPRREKLERLLSEAIAVGDRVRDLLVSLEEGVGGFDREGSDEERLKETMDASQGLVTVADQALAQSKSGLLPINIQMDDAMATALVQRMDLMNVRGRLADQWRNIKIAADDLRSILDLNAAHSLSTRDNNPFQFTGQESQSRVGLAIDLPVNRLRQRNRYREALIGYQVQRRGLMAYEDQIKFDIRQRMRDMAQTRLQYPISVTRAALAAEQVTSIRLQLALGVPGVRGTDLLDALQDLREALIAVANSRMSYIVADAGLAVDLEAMELDELGFWPHINDPEFQPERNLIYPRSAGATYGDIPPFLKVSKMLRRLGQGSLPGADAHEQGSAIRPSESD